MYEAFVKVSEKKKLVFKFILNEDNWQINDSLKEEFDEHGNRNNYVDAEELIPFVDESINLEVSPRADSEIDRVSVDSQLFSKVEDQSSIMLDETTYPEERDALSVSSRDSEVDSTKGTWHTTSEDKEDMVYLSPSESSFTELSFVTSNTKLSPALSELGIVPDDSFESTGDNTQSSINSTGISGIIEGFSGVNDRLDELSRPSREPRGGIFARLSGFFRS